MHKRIYIGLMSIAAILWVVSCTKIADGYLSPTMQYSTKLFEVPQGQYAASNSLVADGSNLPLKVRWTHIYDSTGENVDAIFSKKYLVDVWSASYDSKTDTTYALVRAKITSDSLTPFTVNETSGVITTNKATQYVPLGSYTLDLEVTNSAGTIELPKAITIKIITASPVQTVDDDGVGSFSLSRLNANTPTGASTKDGVTSVFFNGNYNPFVRYSVTKVSDTGNVMIVKVTDRNGVPFSPKNGEIAKRPNSGLNPNPPYLQNLQDYAPDTYQALDTAMFLKYPITPFPISSLGNGYNMYYILPTKYVHMDSTSTWSSNVSGVFYQGKTDSHYLGEFKDGLYDYSLRIPLRIQVPGTYIYSIQLLNATHR
ncbi:hypothetical protein SAMN05192529_105161 [Arachidicoccus rhizosphaerae]|jgi:hypothetical protein|uniref:DUF5007 domain-containing protein n=1 Tax=Arachidicoccus rhizosphaerae TaxID=551991 RepID=A0A1H3XGR1_9BACT|nr:hypothetical protein [Arachidicoccus rhizosphaerae]SDZ98577.1 hypothetical protein SAMN05192529_105161 [Arachidicoccus rhizosphaerae]